MALFNDLPLVHEDQMICDFAGKTDFMGDHDHGDAAACQVQERIVNFVGRRMI